MLEGETNLNEHLNLVAREIKRAEGYADEAAAEIAELRERCAMFQRHADAYREHAFNLMQKAEVKALVLPRATLSIRAGVPKVVITDEAALPENCIRIKREPNKILIKELIDQGVPVSGAELSNAQPSLTIRVK
jgi:hypothetical protein